MNPARIHEDVGLIHCLVQWVKICSVGCRHSSDPTLLWLWCRLAAAALIGPLAWEPPYAPGTALKSKKIKEQVQEESVEEAETGDAERGSRIRVLGKNKEKEMFQPRIES